MPPVDHIEPLCEYCSKIPFRKLAREVRQGGMSRWIHGPGERIKRSNCSFCRLVVSAFHIMYQNDAAAMAPILSEVSELRLNWVGDMGPGRRGAFTYNAAFFQIWICIAATTAHQSPMFRNECFKPTIEAELDVGRLSEWISDCTRAHASECAIESSDFVRSFPGLDLLRFIDVEQMSIVELRTVPQYVALSYVWGSVSSIRLTTSNRPSFLLPKAIGKAWLHIPRTIRDAIELVRRLGHRYLWVDALCLLQNDPRDVERGVNVMDNIYECSWLTIIAAYSHSADAGLPGIQEGSRFGSNATRITDDISAGVYLPLGRRLMHSVYDSRAWT